MPSVLTGDDRNAIRKVIDSIGAPVTLGDLQPDGRVVVYTINRAAEEFYGVPSSTLEGRSLDELDLRPKGRAEVIRQRFHQCLERGEALQFRDFAPVDTMHGRRWVHTMMSPLVDEDRKTARVMATLVDVTDLKAAEEHLADALAKILSGFIPICASCKKIREENESWEAVEGYISRHSEARFSHTMCPECEREWYGDLASEE